MNAFICVTHMNASCRTREYTATWRIHMCDITHMNASCRTHEFQTHDSVSPSLSRTKRRICSTYERVMSHTWMAHSLTLASPPLSHVWKSQVTLSHVLKNIDTALHPHILTHANDSCHTCKRLMSHMQMSHVSHILRNSPQRCTHTSTLPSHSLSHAHSLTLSHIFRSIAAALHPYINTAIPRATRERD